MSQLTLAFQIAEIESLPYADLKACYQEIFSRPAPPRLGRDLLRRAIAYQVQAEWLGGLSPRVEKLLKSNSSTRTMNGHRKLEPRSQLVREWQGEMHVVDVIDGGYRWNGERYTSLSAVARGITGARWSGPRFFGLAKSGKQ